MLPSTTLICARGLVEVDGLLAEPEDSAEHNVARQTIVNAESELRAVEVERVLERRRLLAAVAERAVQEPAPAAVGFAGGRVGNCARLGLAVSAREQAIALRVGSVQIRDAEPARTEPQRAQACGEIRQLPVGELRRHRALCRELLGGGPAQRETEPFKVLAEARDRGSAAPDLVRGVHELARVQVNEEPILVAAGGADRRRAGLGHRVEDAAGVAARVERVEDLLIRDRRGLLDVVRVLQADETWPGVRRLRQGGQRCEDRGREGERAPRARPPRVEKGRSVRLASSLAASLVSPRPERRRSRRPRGPRP